MTFILLSSEHPPPPTPLKKGWKFGAGVGFLKRGGRGAGIFPISFFQGLSFLHLEIILPFAKLCYAFEGKKFSAIIILGKRSFEVI